MKRKISLSNKEFFWRKFNLKMPRIHINIHWPLSNSIQSHSFQAKKVIREIESVEMTYLSAVLDSNLWITGKEMNTSSNYLKKGRLSSASNIARIVLTMTKTMEKIYCGLSSNSYVLKTSKWGPNYISQVWIMLSFV